MALGPHLALAERLRHTDPDDLPRLNGQRLSRLLVKLSAVLDCCDDRACRGPALPGNALTDLCQRFDYRVTHALATVARRLGAEGMLVPSCSWLGGGNIVVIADRMREGSNVDLIQGEDPELYLDRSEDNSLRRGGAAWWVS